MSIIIGSLSNNNSIGRVTNVIAPLLVGHLYRYTTSKRHYVTCNNNNSSSSSGNIINLLHHRPLTQTSTSFETSRQQYKRTTSTSSYLTRIDTDNTGQRRHFLSSLLSSPTPVRKQITRVLNFTPEQVFNIVSNVQSYREFLPFCLDSRITRVVNPASCFEAQLTVGSGNIKEAYTSRVEFMNPSFIQASAVNSELFMHLVSQWRFRAGPTPNTCTAECSLDYQFKSSFYAAFMDQFFASSLDTMVDAFERRCTQVYKHGNRPTLY
ncbi:hypothetical protein SAMD00019534_042010 [Acytostelium subglobosum LB1]|uniref:hypothetical protein n=1 Tax=Acytostelium subglobosum LB1 TaxID=1410327 RepID=UPI000644ECF1|nr:hypothetical protein SAMD00019534_042010 [Acytostelium subglobosum LB1]GAM21026.1 hypothetical protein SAMD00019534_042010 [Acytostelium subglobosum LB1]|eukprot:XP_012756160.1 hypothetical protein SAMD00019534_042010 [Acytostelium subglobosum LB1]